MQPIRPMLYRMNLPLPAVCMSTAVCKPNPDEAATANAATAPSLYEQTLLAIDQEDDPTQIGRQQQRSTHAETGQQMRKLRPSYRPWTGSTFFFKSFT